MSERKRLRGAGASGAYSTKSGETYTEEEVKLLEQYATDHANELAGKGHQLSAAFRAGIGIDGPDARHTSHSVWGMLRLALANGGRLPRPSPKTPKLARGGARGGATILGTLLSCSACTCF